jgi:hypothetical protein
MVSKTSVTRETADVGILYFSLLQPVHVDMDPIYSTSQYDYSSCEAEKRRPNGPSLSIPDVPNSILADSYDCSWTEKLREKRPWWLQSLGRRLGRGKKEVVRIELLLVCSFGDAGASQAQAASTRCSWLAAVTC